MQKLAAVLLACAGCATLPKPESWGGGGGSCSQITDKGTANFGIGHATRDGRPYLVVIPAGGGCGQISGGPPASGNVRAADGRVVQWECTTKDGVKGRVKINGEVFRLEDGGVFFIDLRDGRTVVEQAAVDMALLAGGFVEQQLKVLAASDERIARFLRESESPR